MIDELLKLAIPAWEIAVRTVVIYVVLVLGFRLFGKREVGQFTIFDLVLVLLVANAVQPAMTGPDTSLTGGVIIIVVLLGLNWLVGLLRLHSPVVRRLVQSHPTVIAENGRWLPLAMQREGVDADEADAALREHGLSDVSEVKVAVLELDGTISVVPDASKVDITRRRRRFMRRGG